MYKQNTLNAEDIQYLYELYLSLKGTKYSRYYNLFSVVRKDVSKDLNDPKWLSIKQKLDTEGKGECITNYFLDYGPGSFTVLHEDSPRRVTKTAVTLIHKSDDLVGGEIILSQRVKSVTGSVHIPTDADIEQKKEPVPLMRKVSVLSLVGQSVGESVWYPAQLMHGVTEVQQGNRTVLITWYKNENDKVQKESV